MTRYLLDTNVISHLTKPTPAPTLVDWLSHQQDGDLYLSAQTIAELWRGILILPAGARKQALMAWFSGATGPLEMFGDRVLPYAASAALRWAEIMASEQAAGRTRNGADMIIAATALVHDCVVVTDNERDFAGVVELINPIRNTV